MNTEDTNKLYDLGMMEPQTIGDFEVTRVPGGWIFKSESRHYEHATLKSGSESMVFVPYVEKGFALAQKD